MNARIVEALRDAEHRALRREVDAFFVYIRQPEGSLAEYKWRVIKEWWGLTHTVLERLRHYLEKTS